MFLLLLLLLLLGTVLRWCVPGALVRVLAGYQLRWQNNMGIFTWLVAYGSKLHGNALGWLSTLENSTGRTGKSPS